VDGMDRRDLELHSAADCMLYTSHLVWCTLDAMPVNRHALERSLEQRIGLRARPISAAASHAVRALVSVGARLSLGEAQR
jgi:hypothetical protein